MSSLKVSNSTLLLLFSFSFLHVGMPAWYLELQQPFWTIKQHAEEGDVWLERKSLGLQLWGADISTLDVIYMRLLIVLTIVILDVNATNCNPNCMVVWCLFHKIWVASLVSLAFWLWLQLANDKHWRKNGEWEEREREGYFSSLPPPCLGASLWPFTPFFPVLARGCSSSLSPLLTGLWQHYFPSLPFRLGVVIASQYC